LGNAGKPFFFIALVELISPSAAISSAVLTLKLIVTQILTRRTAFDMSRLSPDNSQLCQDVATVKGCKQRAKAHPARTVFLLIAKHEPHSCVESLVVTILPIFVLHNDFHPTTTLIAVQLSLNVN
jgi:hypothetical protein